MVNIPFHTYKKAELMDFVTKRCLHGKLYYEHPNCWIKERGKKLKVGFLDIETNNLDANYGIMLTYCIKTENKDEILSGRIKKCELMSEDLDKKLCEKLIKDMWKYDVLIGYYSSKFDMPFIRTRCLHHNISFPEFNSLKHKDVYYMVRGKMKLNRNSLENACRLMGIEGKTHIESKYWIRAMTGDRKSIDYILEHNEYDVIILEELYHKLQIFQRNVNKSI